MRPAATPGGEKIDVRRRSSLLCQRLRLPAEVERSWISVCIRRSIVELHISLTKKKPNANRYNADQIPNITHRKRGIMSYIQKKRDNAPHIASPKSPRAAGVSFKATTRSPRLLEAAYSLGIKIQRCAAEFKLCIRMLGRISSLLDQILFPHNISFTFPSSRISFIYVLFSFLFFASKTSFFRPLVLGCMLYQPL